MVRVMRWLGTCAELTVARGAVRGAGAAARGAALCAGAAGCTAGACTAGACAVRCSAAAFRAGVGSSAHATHANRGAKSSINDFIVDKEIVVGPWAQRRLEQIMDNEFFNKRHILGIFSADDNRQILRGRHPSANR